MKHPCFLVGVDGGGSKTLALLADESRRVIGRGQAGSSNYNSVGREAAQTALRQAIAGAFADAGQRFQPADALCMGLAGVGRPEDFDWAEAWAKQEHLAEHVVVVSDVGLLLAAGTPDGWGVGVISGTGSIVFGRACDGRAARAGGWGYLMGDEGSGYALGREALCAVARAADGRGPQTALTAAILRHWGLSAPAELIGRVYRGSAPHSPNEPPGQAASRAEIAALADLVHTAAVQNDRVALGLTRRAGAELARGVLSVKRALRLPNPIPCALAGGVLTHMHLVSQALVHVVQQRNVTLEPVAYVDEPARGALRLAQETAFAFSQRPPSPT